MRARSHSSMVWILVSLMMLLWVGSSDAVNLCSISGQVFKADGSADANDTVWFYPSPPNQIISGTAISSGPLSTTTDANGNLTPISIAQGLTIKISLVNGGGATITAIVPLSSSATFANVIAGTNLASNVTLNALTAPATGNYAMGGFKLTGLGADTATGDALSRGNSSLASFAPLTADYSANAHKFTLLATDTATGDALSRNQSTLNSLASPSAAYSMNNQRLTLLPAPTTIGDALSEGNPIGAISPAAATLSTLSATGATTLNTLTTTGNTNLVGLTNAGQFSSNSITQLPSTNSCASGQINDTGVNTQHDYTLCGNVTITLNYSVASGSNDEASFYDFLQPATGSTFTWTFVTAGGAPLVWHNGGAVPTACTTNGCLDRVEMDYDNGANLYAGAQRITNGLTAGSGGGGAGSATCAANGGTTYYVDSAAGNDSNNGTTTSTPWQHISKIIGSTLIAGDAVLLKGGSTWPEQFDVPTGFQGTAAKNICFGSYGTGQPIIDGGNTRQYGIDAIGGSPRYLTFANWEVKRVIRAAVTFQTSNGNMPGITVQNFYIHDVGQGCSNSAGSCVGTDTTYTYANQLDFQDSTQGADGVHFINNIVKWTGGHNCLEVHHDTGAVLVKGNTVGPGCVHVAIDLKGPGSSGTPATVSSNIASCGYASTLCGCQSTSTCGTNPTPAFYIENVHSPTSTVTYSQNVAYDSYVGLQFCPGGCAGGACATNVKVYNNTFYIPSGAANSYGVYAASLTCDGSASSGAQGIDLRNNIIDGAANYSVTVGTGFSPHTEDYNNIGGVQGSPAFTFNGSSTKGAHDQTNVNPLYTNAGAGTFTLLTGSPDCGAGLAGLTTGNNAIGYFPC